MKRRIFTAVAALLLMIPLSVNAAPDNRNTQDFAEFNQPKQFAHGRKRGREWGINRMLEQLDLTPEQSQQIDSIREQSRNEHQTLHEEIQNLHDEMRSLLASDASAEQLREQHQQMQALHQQLHNNRFETMLQIREILTPEQRSQMAQFMENKRGRRGENNFEG